jgi:hypothetical protein
MNPFPKVTENRTFFVKSNATPNYNCISWVVQCDIRVIWPDERKQFAWPDHLIPRQESLACFKTFFELAGYTECRSGEYEHGKEKIALYARNDVVTHAARQLPSGRWTSKMGWGVDAEHIDPGTLSSDENWRVVMYMERFGFGPPVLPLLNPPPPLIIMP